MTSLKFAYITIFLVVSAFILPFVIGYFNHSETDVNKMVKKINECSSMNRSLMEALTSSDPRDIIAEPPLMAPVKH